MGDSEDISSRIWESHGPSLSTQSVPDPSRRDSWVKKKKPKGYKWEQEEVTFPVRTGHNPTEKVLYRINTFSKATDTRISVQKSNQ